MRRTLETNYEPFPQPTPEARRCGLALKGDMDRVADYFFSSTPRTAANWTLLRFSSLIAE